MRCTMEFSATLALSLRNYLAKRNSGTEEHSYAYVGDGNILVGELDDFTIERYIV